MSENVKAIYPALGEIMAGSKAISKSQVVDTGKSRMKGYKFRGIDDVSAALHDLFAEAGVIILPEVLEHSFETITLEKEWNGKKSISTTRHHLTKVKYTFVSTKDGSSVEAITKGECAESSDKGVGKTLSYALKVLLLQMFLIPVDNQDDPDRVNNPLPANHKPPAKQQNPLDVYRQRLLQALKDKQIQLGTIEDKVGKSLADFVLEDYKTASQVIQRIGLYTELVTRLGASGMTVQALEAEHGSSKDWSNDEIKELINHLKGE